LETKKGRIESPRPDISVKSVSWESSRVSGIMICREPVYAKIIALEGCCFFVAPTRVSSAFAANGDGPAAS
jgi:hypothetical protein